MQPNAELFIEFFSPDIVAISSPVCSENQQTQHHTDKATLEKRVIRIQIKVQLKIQIVPVHVLPLTGIHGTSLRLLSGVLQQRHQRRVRLLSRALHALLELHHLVVQPALVQNFLSQFGISDIC